MNERTAYRSGTRKALHVPTRLPGRLSASFRPGRAGKFTRSVTGCHNLNTSHFTDPPDGLGVSVAGHACDTVGRLGKNVREKSGESESNDGGTVNPQLTILAYLYIDCICYSMLPIVYVLQDVESFNLPCKILQHLNGITTASTNPLLVVETNNMR